MDQLIKNLLSVDVWGIAKLFVLFGLGIYMVFAFIVVRQVKQMTEVVSGLLTGFLRFASWLFFLFSIGVFVFALIFL